MHRNVYLDSSFDISYFAGYQNIQECRLSMRKSLPIKRKTLKGLPNLLIVVNF